MNKWKKFQRKIKYKGKTYNSVYEACNELKFSYKLALSRLAKSESVENVFFKGKLLSYIRFMLNFQNLIFAFTT